MSHFAGRLSPQMANPLRPNLKLYTDLFQYKMRPARNFPKDKHTPRIKSTVTNVLYKPNMHGFT